MAAKKTKKGLAPKKREKPKVIVLVPDQLGLAQADILKLEEKLKSEVSSVVGGRGGDICLVTCVANGIDKKH
jgi:hypothetical protein